MRNAARVDKNQAEIVATLRQLGIAVEVIGLPVDLLCCWRGVLSLLECKTDDGKLTKYQVEFISRWPGPVHIVRNSDDAIRAICGDRVME